MQQSRQRGRVFLLFSIAVALAAAILAYSTIRSSTQQEPSVPVLVAQRMIPERTSFQENSLDPQVGLFRVEMIPSRLASTANRALVSLNAQGELDREATTRLLAGLITRVALNEGDILQRNMVIDQNSGLGPDMRAIGLALNPVTSVGASIQPFNRVDIIISYETKDEEGNKIPRTEVLLQNILILSTVPRLDQGTSDGTVSTDGSSATTSDQRAEFDSEGNMLRDITVVLAVTPADALKLTYMENFATEVRLVARGAGDNNIVPLNPVGPEQYQIIR